MAEFESAAGNAIAVFTELPLDLLEEEWIQLAWDGKYTDVAPPDLNFDLNDENVSSLIDQISNACDVCNDWCRHSLLEENRDGQEDRLWKALMDSGVHHKTLLGLLYGFITLGSTATASFTQKNIALKFTKLYFNLILVPGSKAYGIFQESLFQVAVQCLRLPDKKVTSCITSDSTCSKGSQSSKNARPSGRRKQAAHRDDSSSNESTYSEAEEISKEALCDHFTYITDCLKDLARMLESFSMLTFGELTEFVIQQVCELTQVDIPGSHVAFSNRSQLQSCHYKYLTFYAYGILKQLCFPLHGCPADNFLSIAKYLMPNILMSSGSGTTVSRTVSNIRDHAVSFVTHVMEQQKEGDMEDVIKILISNLAIQVVDKSDFRLKTAQAIMALMGVLNDERFSELLTWFGNLLLSSHSNRRVFALEMVALLIWEDRVGSRRADLLLSALGRCNDKVAAVKTKALGVLASVTSEPPDQWMPLFRGSADPEPENEGMTVQDDRFSRLIQMLTLRADDDKVHVRRTALSVLENVLCASGDFLKAKYMKMLQDRCRDPAVLVRKQALQCLTRCLQVHSNCDAFLPFWLKGVLTAVVDNENSVQEKAVDLVESVLVAPLDEAKGTGGPDLMWRLLGLLTQEDYLGYHVYLQKAIGVLARTNKLRPQLPRRLKPHIVGSNSASAWLLISKLALFADLGEADFAIEYWKGACQSDSTTSNETRRHVLQVIRKTAHHLSSLHLEGLVGHFEKSLEELTLPLEVLPKAVDCLCALSYTLYKGDEAKWRSHTTTWGKRTLERCSAYLSPVLLGSDTKQEDCTEDQIVYHLVMLGEAAQCAPNDVTERIQNIVEICVSAPHDSEIDAAASSTKKRRKRKTNLKSTGVKPVGFTVTQRIRAHGFVTLGKMCLQNEVFAKRSVAALAKELDKSNDLIIRNNIIVILGDLCKRYAVLVDPYFPYVTACLKDPSPDLRRLTLETLFGLLRQDFLKLQGSLIYNLLTMLVDECKSIRELAEYGLGVQVYARHPHVFYRRFTETMFHFNNIRRNLQQQDVTPNESVINSFLGGENRAEKRMIIYRFLLDHMSDEERFKLNLAITDNVLACCLQEGNSLTTSCPELLKDALAVLCSEEIKLRSITAADDGTEEDIGRVALNAARKNILSHCVKRNLVENVIPVVVELKRRLEAERSPLLHNLLLFLRELMQDYKSEVMDILALDKNTASEVAFDLKKLEEKEKEMKDTAKGKNIPPPEVPHTPRTPRCMQAVLQTLESARKLKENAVKQKLGKDKGQLTPDDCAKEHQKTAEGHEQQTARDNNGHDAIEETAPLKTVETNDVFTKVRSYPGQDGNQNDPDLEHNVEQVPTVGGKHRERVSTAQQQNSGNNSTDGHASPAFKTPPPKSKQVQRKSKAAPGKQTPQVATPSTPVRSSACVKSPRRRFSTELENTLLSPKGARKMTQNKDEFKRPQMSVKYVEGSKGGNLETSTPARSREVLAPFPSDVSIIKK